MVGLLLLLLGVVWALVFHNRQHPRPQAGST